MDEERQLIPGLPDDIALNCIARVPHRFLPHLQRVCRRWRDLFTAPFFRRYERGFGSAEDLVFVVQAVIGPIPLFAECAAVDGRNVIVGGWDFVTLDRSREVRVLDLVTGEWSMGRPMAAARFVLRVRGDRTGKYSSPAGHDGMKNGLRMAEALRTWRPTSGRTCRRWVRGRGTNARGFAILGR
ncbi:F-box/kelch-repeat protein [Apostasia shenzhenica]|uniref:F-box/kelch-repeat protein n=1 Tax=Apostasia shenzhenica TaxID=1088818 RepID=A0A2I0A6T1_9ASPA|nr:F-box/kelch-repeat protein [Apostasia shenzhenica]